MMTDFLIAFWEKSLARAKEQIKDVPEPFRENRYLRDVLPYRHILRMVRLKAGIPICWGTDCMDTPLTLCAVGKHETWRALR